MFNPNQQKIFSCVNLQTGKPCPIPERTVLALGTFDGVHIGHKALLLEAKRVAEEKSKNGKYVTSGVFCFSCPPMDILSPNPPKHITTLDLKLSYMAELGVEVAFVADFSQMRDMSAADFIDFLISELSSVSVVCGFNFKFAKEGEGNASLLSKKFGEDSFIIQPVMYGDEPCSSSRIRAALSGGDIKSASEMLGRPFSISGEVIHGKHLGREIGIPTINIAFSEKAVIPLFGIYVSSVCIDGKEYAAVSNIGRRPSVESTDIPNCETHILDYTGDLYGKKVVVRLYERLRDEEKFSSIEELRSAILSDEQAARQYFESI